MAREIKHIHPTKIADIIYPVFAKDFWMADEYSDFAEIVQTQFDLTPEQWDALLNFYEKTRNL